MPSRVGNPTPYPEVNDILLVLAENVETILGSHFVGMYLDGSLTSGDFDEDSDIDFIVGSDQDISGGLFSALQEMHTRIAAIDSSWAIQLEGSYISLPALRRFDLEHALHPNIERGRGERLKIVYHGEEWAVHRYVLRERGITIIGPSPQTLIDPVLPGELRRAMLPLLRGWLKQILDHPQEITNRGCQSYIVLTLCRILYTLQFDEVVSKPVAARWAQETKGKNWVKLIDRAWVGRHNPQLKAQPVDVNETLDLIRDTLEYSQQFEMLVSKADERHRVSNND